MKAGETSPPVVSERGVHILHLDAVDGERRTISQIFYPLEIGEADVARARARAAEAYDRLTAGDPFATVVAAYSQDPTSLARGGDLGRFALSDLSPTVQENLADLGPGRFSEPFLTPAGFYIFLVKDRTYGSRVALDDVRQEVRQAVESEKMQTALAAYVESLRARFVVDRKE
jgi:parvulin-like peptidyl-prolyl isomerase